MEKREKRGGTVKDFETVQERRKIEEGVEDGRKEEGDGGGALLDETGGSLLHPP